MRFLPSDKYNVAWFKLAECVSRGEREKALGVYRLLAHSFDDAAFSRQLEGDILLAFDDVSGALHRYREAAELYQQSERNLEAAAVYEHIFVLDSHKQEYVMLLAQLYMKLQITAKAATYLHMQCSLALSQYDFELAAQTLNELEKFATQDVIIAMRQHYITLVMKDNPLPDENTIEQIQRGVDMLAKSENPHALQQFLLLLEESNSAYALVAQEHLTQP